MWTSLFQWEVTLFIVSLMLGFDRQPSGALQEAILKAQTFNKIKVCTEVLNYTQIEKYVSFVFYVKFNIETCSVSFFCSVHTHTIHATGILIDG